MASDHMDRRGTTATYAGTLFRSHLEARYAIFFDQLDLKWEYEPQGFVIDGTAYLPDFVVFAAMSTIWVEIKPDWDADPDGVAKWRKFAPERPQPSRAVLLIGKPSVQGRHVVIGGGGDATWEDDGQEWRPCSAGYHFDLAFPGTWRTKFADDGCPDSFGGDGEHRIEKAVRAALSHRFGKFSPRGTAALDGRRRPHHQDQRENAGASEDRRGRRRCRMAMAVLNCPRPPVRDQRDRQGQRRGEPV
jgi:hypothetical protein